MNYDDEIDYSNDLHRALTAKLMDGACMDEKEACDFAYDVLMMFEEGYYREHDGPNPLGTHLFQFAPYRWEPGEAAPTPESVREAQVEMEDRINRITGTTPEQRQAAVIARMLGGQEASQ